MKCPYCVSQIADQALVCPVCSRDLYLFKPLLERQATLELTVTAQAQEIAALAARIESLAWTSAQATPPTVPALAHPEISFTNRNFWWSSLQAVVLALVSVHAASWFARLIYDAPDIVLRLLTVAVSLPFGYFLARRHPHRLSQTIYPAIVLGVSAVAIWRALNQTISQVPFVPQGLAEWREALEYVAGMALAFFTGALVRQTQMLLSASQRSKAPTPLRWLASLFRSNEKGETGIDALAHNLQKATMMVTPLATGITAIYAAVDGVI